MAVACLREFTLKLREFREGELRKQKTPFEPASRQGITSNLGKEMTAVELRVAKYLEITFAFGILWSPNEQRKHSGRVLLSQLFCSFYHT